MSDGTLLYINILLLVLVWIKVWKPLIRSICESQIILLELKTKKYFKENKILPNSELAIIIHEQYKQNLDNFYKLKLLNILIMRRVYKKYPFGVKKSKLDLELENHKKHQKYINKVQVNIGNIFLIYMSLTSIFGLIAFIFAFFIAVFIILWEFIIKAHTQSLLDIILDCLPFQKPQIDGSLIR